MGMYLNPGNESFQEALNSKIYIDKTGLLTVTNEKLKTQEKYMAVSRPRRFGKTMGLSMLNAYYGNSFNSEEMFKPYKIYNDESFGKYLNKYNVIFINMRDVVSDADRLDDALKILEEDIKEELLYENEGVAFNAERPLHKCLDKIYSQNKTQFVFLIDEWDAVFRVKGISSDEQIKYLDFLRTLLKDKTYVALAYMTGILPIKKYGEHSALNMFTEYSMTDQRELAEYTGFTEDEVKELCREYDMSYDETRRWYDGYNLRGMSVYNPRSVVMSMTGHVFDSYWTKTESYEALKVYIEMNIDNLRDKVIEMIGGAHVPINTLKFVNDMTTFNSSDDVLTLLIHLGYLTYDFDKKECYIPNAEVQQEFINSIEDRGWEEVMSAIRDSENLIEATLNKDTALVEEKLEKIHQSETSIMAYNDEKALSAVITIAYYTARKDYEIARELPAGKGFADICFIPRKNVSKPAMVVELKLDKEAQGAISQIKDKNYVESLRGYTGKVLLAGISYDRNTKKHSCVIEETEKA